MIIIPVHEEQLPGIRADTNISGKNPCAGICSFLRMHVRTARKKRVRRAGQISSSAAVLLLMSVVKAYKGT
jgi:hypothetical protein